MPWYVYPAACCALTGAGCGWMLGYAHRELVEWGRGDPLRRLLRAYRELWRDTVHLWTTGELR